jgi:putative transposase
MYQARITYPTQTTVFHLLSRAPQGQRLWQDDAGKEKMRELLWRVAEFSGVEIITYALMSNHFHILVRVPMKERADVEVTDAQLLWRIERLNGKRAVERVALMVPEGVIKRMAEAGTPVTAEGEVSIRDVWSRERGRWMRRMHDVSEFMRLFKSRCCGWYNATNTTFGTVWAGRFKSQVLESRAEVLRAVALYIDLNPVRAGLVEDPKDYRWCGYAEAVAGHGRVREQLSAVMEKRDWAEGGPSYRLWLMGKGRRSQENEGKRALPEALAKRVEAERGELSEWAELRQRVRYFSEGAAFGGREFIRRVAQECATELRRKRAPQGEPVVRGDSGAESDWVTLRRFRDDAMTR